MTEYHMWAVYRPQKCISHSCRCWEVWDQGASRFSVCEGPPSESQLLVVSRWRNDGGFSWTSLVRAISPLMASPPSKAPPPAAILLGVGISIYEFSGDATIFQVIAHSMTHPSTSVYLSGIHSSLLFNLSHIHHSNVYVGICLANLLCY